MAPIDLTRDVQEAKEKNDSKHLFADIEFLHKDAAALKTAVEAANQANEILIQQGILPSITIEHDKAKSSEKITVGDRSVVFTLDGATQEFADAEHPHNMTKIVRKDGSKTELTWSSDAIEAVVNTDQNGKQTKVEAINGVTIKCDNETGAITTTKADGTSTVQRSDGVVEHRDQNGVVKSCSDSTGRTIASGSSVQVDIASSVAGILSRMSSGDPADARNCMDELNAIFGQLDPFVTSADPTIAATARDARVIVSSAMAGIVSRSMA